MCWGAGGGGSRGGRSHCVPGSSSWNSPFPAGCKSCGRGRGLSSGQLRRASCLVLPAPPDGLGNPFSQLFICLMLQVGGIFQVYPLSRRRKFLTAHRSQNFTLISFIPRFFPATGVRLIQSSAHWAVADGRPSCSLRSGGGKSDPRGLCGAALVCRPRRGGSVCRVFLPASGGCRKCLALLGV